jgi:MoxR-like ATPase
MSVLNSILDLKQRVMQDIVGQEDIVQTLILGILANGNLLVEGLPGLAKTRAIKSLSSHMEGDFKRIQFTPDLTTPDITGRQILYNDGEKSAYQFEKGPIFANFVLADEVNRAPPRSQNSLLEAMEERQVTVAGVAHKVPKLFLVMATQNPVEQEGTFPLPEAQMDRFLLHVIVNYPDEEAEASIIRLVRDEMKTKKSKDEAEKATPTPQETVFAARSEIDNIVVPEKLERYMVDLIFATRYPQRYSYDLKRCIKLGASPRGSLAIDRCARTHAWLNGQTEVEAGNIRAVIHNVLRHRILLKPKAKEDNITSNDVIDEIVKLVAVP